MSARIGRSLIHSPGPLGRAFEPRTVAPGILDDALVCTRWAPIAERTGGYVHLWGREDLRGPWELWVWGEAGVYPTAGAF